MANRTNREREIGQFFLFSGFTPSELADVEPFLSSAVRYEKGTTIFDPVVFHQSLGLVLLGRILVKSASASHPLVMNRLTAGDVFGAAALFDPDTSTYVTELTALDTVVIRYITQDNLRRLFERFPKAAQNYIVFLSGRIRFLNRKLAAVTDGSSVNRLYHYFVSNQNDDGIVVIQGSMKELANRLNMGHSSLYRSLNTLLEEHLIEKDGKHYRLLQ